EVREPGRTLPRALIGASVLVIALYLFVNAGYFYVLSPETVANISANSSVAGEVLVRLLGAGGAALLTAGLMLSSFGALHSNSLTTSRVPFAMARHGLLPRPLARVSPRTHVPTNAVLLLGVCAIGFARARSISSPTLSFSCSCFLMAWPWPRSMSCAGNFPPPSAPTACGATRSCPPSSCWAPLTSCSIPSSPPRAARWPGWASWRSASLFTPTTHAGCHPIGRKIGSGKTKPRSPRPYPSQSTTASDELITE
ncbi:MAG: APC family permease, partial [Chthoniobacterales bacterium]|nr:APC family permease [Chthoniobacterales bacterium]